MKKQFQPPMGTRRSRPVLKMLVSRAWLILAASMVIVLIQVPSAQAETIQQGPWSAENSIYKSPMYDSRTGNVSACVTANHAVSAQWRFWVVWYDGGQDKRIWSSDTFNSTTTHCS